MKRFLPAPTMRLFRGEPCVFMPTFAEEFVWTIRQTAPRERGNGINHLPKFGFRLLDFVKCILKCFLRLFALMLRPLSVLDVEHQAIPIGDPTFGVEERLSDGLNPSILTIRPPELVLILVRSSRSGRLQPPLHGCVAVIG